MTKRFYVVDILAEDIDEATLASYGGVDGKAWTDTQRYPQLRELVEDECQQFMVSMEDAQTFWTAEDFINSFIMTEITIEEFPSPLVHG